MFTATLTQVLRDAAAAALAWAVLVYIGVDFGFWGKVLDMSNNAERVWRAAGEAILAATLLVFLFAYLNLSRWHVRYSHITVGWLTFLGSLVALDEHGKDATTIEQKYVETLVLRTTMSLPERVQRALLRRQVVIDGQVQPLVVGGAGSIARRVAALGPEGGGYSLVDHTANSGSPSVWSRMRPASARAERRLWSAGMLPCDPVMIGGAPTTRLAKMPSGTLMKKIHSQL